MSLPAARWASSLTAPQQRRVRRLVDAAAQADGVAPVGEQVVRALAQDGAHLLAPALDDPSGYAALVSDGGQAVAELAVDPRQRGRGVGATLLAGVRERATDVRVWAHGDLPAARALAASAGMVGVRDLWQLRRGLADMPAVAERPEAPDGVTLSTYRRSDDEEFLAVNNAAFAWHPEQGGWTGAELAERRGEAWFDPAGLFLARDSGTDELLGFHWTKVHPARDGEAALGEVYVLGVAPAAQGRGLGRYLTLVGLHHLRAQGLSTALLYVEGDNTAGLHTYERLGFLRFHLDRMYGRADSQ